MRWLAVAVLCLFAASASADWGAKRDPFDVGTVNRYKAILAKNPHDEGALRQLVALYKRFRTLAKLEAEFVAMLETSDDWAVNVVLARFPREDKGLAREYWRHAVIVKATDARTWIGLGDASRSIASEARDAYMTAAQNAKDPKDKKLALTKVIGVALPAVDGKIIDDAYAQLIVLSPKDGALWLDRGNAQLATKQYADARKSFEQAESLLKTDPERRLTAMVDQGIALEAAGKSDDAITQYIRTLDATPKGHFLAEETVLRIVETQRKRKQVAAAIDWIEKRWPEKKRGHFEWALLGDLYTNDASAMNAYKHAVAKAPTEIATHRKLIAVLDKLDPTAALKQHEVAAKIAPGDALLQIELAKRYHAEQPEKALAVLDTLARRMSTNISVRNEIATLYDSWDENTLAIREYEAIAKIEPTEPDHVIALGDAYWRATEEIEAYNAWRRLDAIGTADAFYRHAEILAGHGLWDDAVEAYTNSIDKGGMNANVLYGRARGLAELQHYPEAAADARRAAALANQDYATGQRERALLVKLLGRTHTLDASVQMWRFAFDHGDNYAGYMLAAHHGRESPFHHDMLVQLYRRVPADDSLGIAYARSLARKKELKKARAELERIAKRTPDRAKDVARAIEQIDDEIAAAERERLREDEELRIKDPDIIGEDRVGMRLVVGTDVRGTSSALVGASLYYAKPRGGFATPMRFDWIHRDDDRSEHGAVALSYGIQARLLDRPLFELAIGANLGGEIRYGSGVPAVYDRAALGGELNFDVMPRRLPAVLGLRLHQSFTDSPRSTTLLVEVGFEIRDL